MAENVVAFNKLTSEIFKEFIRATGKHPNFPKDVVYQAAVVAEENGEVMRASVQYAMEGGNISEVRKELIQTGAMVFRMLMNLPEEKEAQ